MCDKPDNYFSTYLIIGIYSDNKYIMMLLRVTLFLKLIKEKVSILFPFRFNIPWSLNILSFTAVQSASTIDAATC